ncbi:MAG: T9SS type A sorting domain-containing protein, partial [bacterium]
KWSNRVWTIVALFDNREGDFVGVFELAPNSSWVEYTPRSATVVAGEQIPVEFTITSADLDTGRYGINVQFIHNAAGGTTIVPITLYVTDTLIVPAVNREAELPQEWALEPNFPNPFNSATAIKFSVPLEATVRLEVFDILGRSVEVLVNDRKLAPGRYSLIWDARSLPGGLYFYRFTSLDYSATKKMILIK